MNYRESFIGKFNHLSHHVKHGRFKKLEALGLYQGQPRLLHILGEEDGISQRELARRMGITPATLTRMLQRMEKNGLIRRRPDEQDQRIIRVFPSEKARDVMAELNRMNRAMEEELLGDFNGEERKQLILLIDRMIERIHTMDGYRHGAGPLREHGRSGEGKE